MLSSETPPFTDPNSEQCNSSRSSSSTTAYLSQLKKELKLWEKQFLANNGRDPNTDDIRGIPEIVQKYKLYNKYKKATTSITTKPAHRRCDRDPSDANASDTQVSKIHHSASKPPLPELFQQSTCETEQRRNLRGNNGREQDPKTPTRKSPSAVQYVGSPSRNRTSLHALTPTKSKSAHSFPMISQGRRSSIAEKTGKEGEPKLSTEVASRRGNGGDGYASKEFSEENEACRTAKTSHMGETSTSDQHERKAWDLRVHFSSPDSMTTTTMTGRKLHAHVHDADDDVIGPSPVKTSVGLFGTIGAPAGKLNFGRWNENGANSASGSDGTQVRQGQEHRSNVLGSVPKSPSSLLLLGPSVHRPSKDFTSPPAETSSPAPSGPFGTELNKARISRDTSLPNPSTHNGPFLNNALSDRQTLRHITGDTNFSVVNKPFDPPSDDERMARDGYSGDMSDTYKVDELQAPGNDEGSDMQEDGGVGMSTCSASSFGWNMVFGMDENEMSNLGFSISNSNGFSNFPTSQTMSSAPVSTTTIPENEQDDDEIILPANYHFSRSRSGRSNTSSFSFSAISSLLESEMKADYTPNGDMEMDLESSCPNPDTVGKGVRGRRRGDNNEEMDFGSDGLVYGEAEGGPLEDDENEPEVEYKKRRIQPRTTRKAKIAPLPPLQATKKRKTTEPKTATGTSETRSARNKKNPDPTSWGNANRPMQPGGEDGWGFTQRGGRGGGKGTGMGGSGSGGASVNIGRQVSQNFVSLKLQKGFKRGSRRFVNHGWKGNGYGPSTPLTNTYGSYVKPPAHGEENPFQPDTPEHSMDPDDMDLVLEQTQSQSSTCAGNPTGGVVVVNDGEEETREVAEVEVEEERNLSGLCTPSQKFQYKHTDFTGTDPMEEDVDGSSRIRVDLKKTLKDVWGFDEFREGQLLAIMRILHCKSTILVLPTGAGKSLCYQLPALVLSNIAGPCLTLVVSPMISLMMDQVRWLPRCLPGVCITSNIQSQTEYASIVSRLCSNEIKILFLSPEKLASQSFIDLVRSGKLPPIKFACIDEVHCLSEWSHNFRPSYLLLHSILKEQLKVPCVLGITGTATGETRKSICDMLELDPKEVIYGDVIRRNLKLSVSMDANREEALVRLLRTPTFRNMKSMIIYVMRQAEADKLASHLRVRGFNCDSYHAGKAPQDRETTQNNFMTSRLRILVATIAFGLGLNKRDVRSVIHFSLPKSLENYVQEIGRSGRDGRVSHCHTFLHTEDYLQLRSFSHADGVDDAAIGWILYRIFGREGKRCSGSKISGYTPFDVSSSGTKKRSTGTGKASLKKKRKTADMESVGDGGAEEEQVNVEEEVEQEEEEGNRALALSIERTEDELDIKKEVIATLLSYLELVKEKPIRVLPPIFAICTVTFVKTPSGTLADQYPVIDTILKNSNRVQKKCTFECLKVCAAADLSFAELQRHLTRLRYKKEIMFEFSDPSFHIRILRECISNDGTPDDGYLEELKAHLVQRSRSLEKSRIEKVDQVYNLMRRVATDDLDGISFEEEDAAVVEEEDVGQEDSIREGNRSEQARRTALLHAGIGWYFGNQEDDEVGGTEEGIDEMDRRKEEARVSSIMERNMCDPVVLDIQRRCKPTVESNLQTFVSQNVDIVKSGRAVARIFHGIQSPKYTALDWHRNQFWKKHIPFDFAELAGMAQRAIAAFKLGKNTSRL